MVHYITDLDGNLLEVTDLKEAIFQVAMYISYLHDQPREELEIFAHRRKIYWKDIYTKLNQLKIKQSLSA
ncbi:hypothetical protein [Pedobacter nyackensis]|uniref:hypothetical protein n=1 Tax=Pedobacter nyackensis TaxID=475255 RepID=UPI00292E9AC2|nr:hypothetical protein [Pedobacter nyackensis]